MFESPFTPRRYGQQAKISYPLFEIALVLVRLDDDGGMGSHLNIQQFSHQFASSIGVVIEADAVDPLYHGSIVQPTEKFSDLAQRIISILPNHPHRDVQEYEIQ